MPLMSFSEPDHIAKLLDGRKQQTTRLPRKNPIKEGNTLLCYYKPRMKKGTCDNCISECGPATKARRNYEGCGRWNNFFGKATVTKVDRLLGEIIMEGWDSWAVADGFKDFKDAHEWFMSKTGESNWYEKEYEVIHFTPHWLKENCDECGHNIEYDLLLDCKDPINGVTVCEPAGYECSKCGHEGWF